jgi:cytochrome c oxidase assembly protein subunit 15
MEIQSKVKSFRTILWISIVITYLLILVGAAVRATGSGMGCPDWPKCFGQYIPPTDVSQLPANYKEVFKVEGKEIADFNAFHTWVEYLNRLLGVVEGFAILGLLIAAFRIRKNHKKLWIGSVFTFILVLIIGWVGSKVVSSNLAPAKITLHMILALAMSFMLVGMLFLVNAKNDNKKTRVDKGIFYFFIAYFILTLLQIILGTQVRQQIDVIAIQLQNTHREVWMENLDEVFTFHKLMALLLLFAFIAAYLFWRRKIDSKLNVFFRMALVVLILEFIIGDTLSRLMPAALQPFHLFIANVFVGLVFYILMHINIRLWAKDEEIQEKK